MSSLNKKQYRPINTTILINQKQKPYPEGILSHAIKINQLPKYLRNKQTSSESALTSMHVKYENNYNLFDSRNFYTIIAQIFCQIHENGSPALLNCKKILFKN